jgi:hypothetical protein
MKKTVMCIGIIIDLVLLLLFSACKSTSPGPGIQPEDLYSNELNQEIEDLTSTEPAGETFEAFMFNYTERPEAEYEIARDDIFSLSMGGFESTEISFFGVMLGDTMDKMIEMLGHPDSMYIAPDQSYTNVNYRKKIGIGEIEEGMTIHLENNTITRITVKPSFAKYLQGNTSIGTRKQTLYILLDLPDYQDFLSYLRVFHYVEKGVEIYLKADKIERMSFIMPGEFKGVEFITVTEKTSEGIFANVTKTVPLE